MSQTAAGGTKNNLSMTIVVRNYAGVDSETLEKAKLVATHIFREAGVELRWFDHVVRSEQAVSTGLQPFIFLNVIPSNLAHRLGFQNDVMGFAPGGGGTPDLAYVFSDCVEAFAGTKITEAQILGTAIAHEIGHVLLNLTSHSANGIMRGVWHQEDLQNAARGSLLFTATQAKIIQAELARRAGQRTAVEVAGLESPVQLLPLMGNKVDSQCPPAESEDD